MIKYLVMILLKAEISEAYSQTRQQATDFRWTLVFDLICEVTNHLKDSEAHYILNHSGLHVI